MLMTLFSQCPFLPPISGTAVGGADLDTLSSGTSCLLPRDLSWKSSTFLESAWSLLLYLLPRLNSLSGCSQRRRLPFSSHGLEM